MPHRKMSVAVLGCMSLWLCGQTDASAATISYSDIHPSTLTDWGPFSYLDIPQFNPAMGTLNTVGITLRGSMQSNLTLSNNSSSNSTIIGGGSFVQLDAQFAGLNFSSFMSDIIPGTPFTLIGNSVRTISLSASGIDIRTLSTPADDLSGFIGTGFLPHNWTATGGFSITALGGNTQSTVTTFSDAQIDVVYDYLAALPPATDPVPEPGTMLLLGTGLAGLVGNSFRKKKAA